LYCAHVAVGLDLVGDGLVKIAASLGSVRRQGSEIGEIATTVATLAAGVRARLGIEACRSEMLATDPAGPGWSILSAKATADHSRQPAIASRRLVSS
jgi:hypothetical protein